MRESSFLYDSAKGGGRLTKVSSLLILGRKELKFLRAFPYYTCSDLRRASARLLFVTHVSSRKFGQKHFKSAHILLGKR